MFTVTSYGIAVACCVLTMLCWGSFANTQKLTGKNWRYELFYWDYVLGVVLFALVFGLTAGNIGDNAQWGFITNLKQASGSSLLNAFLGGVIFNGANLLLAAAISIVGLSVAFPVGIGLALVLGVVWNYILAPKGNPYGIFAGVGLIVVAIICNVIACQIRNRAAGTTSGSGGTMVKGLIISVVCGIMMSFFYFFIAKAMDMNFTNPAPAKGLMTPYSAAFIFSLGVFASNFVFNGIAMRFPAAGEPINELAYFKGNLKVHLVGVLGGLIWGLGNGINLVAAGKAGPSISYGLGQGSTLVSVLWGILVWKEFAGAPKRSAVYNTAMLILFVTGLCVIVAAGQ